MQAPAVAERHGTIPGDIQGALEDVDVPCYAIDAFGVVRWLNPAAERLVGDARGRQFTSLVAAEDTREARESFARKVLGGGRSTEMHVALTVRDGERLEVEVSSAPLREDGHVVGVFGIVREEAGAPEPATPARLTPRQAQVLHLLAHGRSTSEIAADLHLSIQTVRNHVRRLLHALGTHSRLEAIAVARRQGLLDG